MVDKKKEKKVETKTTELLDAVNKDVDYSDEVGYRQQQKDDRLLEERKPFSQIKTQIDNMNKEIRELKKTVDMLRVHKHADGEVVIPQKDTYNQYNW